MLVYPIKARNDVGIELCHWLDIAQAEWAPDQQFSAAMTKLQTSDVPQNEANDAILRCQLQELMDEIDGRFHEYTNQFVHIHAKLIKLEAPNSVGQIDLRERVKLASRITKSSIIEPWPFAALM